MEKKRSTYTTLRSEQDKKVQNANETKRKAQGDCEPSESTSHTQLFRVPRHETKFKRITSDEYFNISESISGSSDTFHCVHGLEGKVYSAKGHLKRNFLKVLDPIRVERKWDDDCAPAYGWEMAKKLEFLVQDPTVYMQIERLETHLRDFARTTSNGYKIDILDSVMVILNFLVETLPKEPSLERTLVLLLTNTEKPMLLNASSDVITYFQKFRDYIGFLGYLLMRLEDDKHFNLVSKAILWHLSAPDTARGHGAAQLRHTLAAAAPVLYQTVVRILAVTSSKRFPTFLEMALILACDTVENCIEMMKENIIENIFYRFNPYFPHRRLPIYDINPANPQDVNVKLGDSSICMQTTLSLLLILLQTAKKIMEENPSYRRSLPHPDVYAQRCFIWAYRFECRARGHQQQRITLTVIIGILLRCFHDRLVTFPCQLVPDILSLSVITELPPRNDWIGTVNITTSQLDVNFKKTLIQLSVDFLKAFPYNKFMVESRYWLMGLMYLLDPGLCHLRAHWSPALFTEIRKTSLQALVCTVKMISPCVVRNHGLIRRIMWYIEWYSESPFELPTLYWCIRLLQVAIYTRGDPKTRKSSIRDLFDTHGIIILIHLCYTLMEQKLPPVEKSQVIIALGLRLLTSALEFNTKVSCCVYPDIKWPSSVNALAKKMLDVILYSLDKHFFISDRWLISLLNFIWEAIIWKQAYRVIFVANNGIYQLLDLITMTKGPVQCMALALISDAARADNAVGHLVTWRANIAASYANPIVVKRGATIASLLAAIFRNECKQIGAELDENGIVENLDCPITSNDIREMMADPDFQKSNLHHNLFCFSASDLAGSRMSKLFALLYMLSEDLEQKVILADETYNLYKNIKLAPEDEAVLVLCSHYLTLKLIEVWKEIKIQSPGFLPEDEEILEEFLHIGRGWTKEIKLQQQDVIAAGRKKDQEAENSFYSFLGRVRLNIALDALRDVRCIARSADRATVTHALLHDAVSAHHRRSVAAKKLGVPILRTYGPPLDDQNITGQNVKVYSISAKERPQIGDTSSASMCRTDSE
ncbi:hypothetical protein K1T71_000118 [Dendrolimus kikuchii]|uniref:Uncharacterized protein n=1 Tax=Dendrolimus kikuchii TaxID=765133 RepID=A0ACC1DIL2_9NEOP|nr:hypothetical protein K1T71_000118 [Dendrolimus kikuchii]